MLLKLQAGVPLLPGRRGAVAGDFHSGNFNLVSNSVGELNNEEKMLPGAERSEDLSITSHTQEKDGVLTYLFTAKTVTAHDAGLREQLDELYHSFGRLESA